MHWHFEKNKLFRQAFPDIDYYAREGMQVRKNGSVYALDNEKTEASDIKLSAEQLEK